MSSKIDIQNNNYNNIMSGRVGILAEFNYEDLEVGIRTITKDSVCIVNWSRTPPHLVVCTFGLVLTQSSASILKHGTEYRTSLECDLRSKRKAELFCSCNSVLRISFKYVCGN